MTTHTAFFGYFASATLANGSQLCHQTTDAIVKTASATSEINAGGARYAAVFSDVAAGTYVLKFLSGSAIVGTRLITFSGTDLEEVDAEAAVLNSATQGQINRIEATASGTLSGAGTSTEIFVGPSATVTVTVDASGNRSAVVVS